jgi:hypothetical protein
MPHDPIEYGAETAPVLPDRQARHGTKPGGLQSLCLHSAGRSEFPQEDIHKAKPPSLPRLSTWLDGPAFTAS